MNADIPDPSDWTDSKLAGLKDVDETLRCHICKEFFTAPMITGCGHTFCSLCIQRYLTNTSQRCPTCMQEQQISQLRKNVTVETLVELFSAQRATILRVVKETAKQPVPEPVELPSSPDVDDGRRRSGRKRARTNYTENFDSSDDLQVECPVCQVMVPGAAINRHLDNNCNDSTGSNGGNWLGTKKKTKPLRKIPRVNPASESLANLRLKLQDEGLSISGTRQALFRRYDEWVTLWNANVDNKTPRSKSEVRDDLRRWESTVAASENAQPVKTTIKNIDDRQWVQKHKEDYDYLIEQARKSIRKKQEEKQKELKEELEEQLKEETKEDKVVEMKETEEFQVVS
ncbi:Postreplication repair E3 ubiquitin-protein ligase RAD18 [Yarrowia sp. C11]|nr:Postreplication repair E3 ubiquitin-protein ligase RAD18 [Yarrowia sp. C11]